MADKCQGCPLPDKFCRGEENSYLCKLWASGRADYLKVLEGRVSRPGLLKRVGSFARSAARFAASGFARVTPEVQQSRLSICRGCDRYDADGVRCRECGCYLMEKASWATESCPLPVPKWGPVSPEGGAGGACGSCGGLSDDKST